MNAGLCVCVLLLVLCTSCLGRPHSSQTLDVGPPAFAPASDALLQTDTHILVKPPPLGEEVRDTRANLSELLARLISSRKGSVRRNSAVNSRASNHRIKDRDYLGWMDFGRRSAEEYEYSS